MLYMFILLLFHEIYRKSLTLRIKITNWRKGATHKVEKDGSVVFTLHIKSRNKVVSTFACLNKYIMQYCECMRGAIRQLIKSEGRYKYSL